MTGLTPEIAAKLASLALTHVTREYPNKLDHVLNGPDDLRAPRRLQYGGEIGFLYGKSSGSRGYGREDFAGYIVGTVGNDKFSLTAGFYHQETTFSGPRWRR